MANAVAQATVEVGRQAHETGSQQVVTEGSEVVAATAWKKRSLSSSVETTKALGH